ncbi:hypothetical protein AKJ09_10096 [Labilithrix luteola]|uniref:Uncharacterized protein n=1 Tax=Labilithrix luteola TaxID=1391654 RepID=A0A0K1QCI0_9BACT|nr:hypothetical protein AKJ09_10096 [Labilithrix luteola]
MGRAVGAKRFERVGRADRPTCAPLVSLRVVQALHARVVVRLCHRPPSKPPCP